MTETLPPGLNDFLFTPIASDANGMHLTMLSALARTGVDPWAEAAGLRTLSREDATARIVQMLAGVPNGPSPGDDSASLAARLVVQLHSLPKASLKPVSSTVPATDRAAAPPLRFFSTLPPRVKLTIYSLVTLILMIVGYRALNGDEPQVSDGVDYQQSR